MAGSNEHDEEINKVHYHETLIVVVAAVVFAVVGLLLLLQLFIVGGRCHLVWKAVAGIKEACDVCELLFHVPWSEKW